jgi:hypothetical protein
MTSSCRRLAGAMSGALGLDPSLSQILISLALAAIVLPAYQRLRPLIDGVLFPERRAFEEGIRQLLSDLSACDSAATLTERAGAELDRLLRPATCVVYSRAGDRFAPVFARGVDAVPIDGADPLIAVLERRMAPVAAEGSGSHRRASGLSAYERAALEELRVSVVSPVRGRRGIAAFFSLGPKRSGDIYTATEVAWLSGVADRMSAEFLRFDDARPVAERHRAAMDAPTSPGETTTEVAMLRECPECGTCFSSGTWTCGQDAAPLMSTHVPRFLSDRYRLDRRLGRGGMGTVYEAADMSLGRAVAIKIIREDLPATRDAAERFRKEARATAAFAHPNVVTVHDFGVASTAIPFLVLELLKGCSLRQEQDRARRLPPPRVMEITRTLCEVLSVAHGRSLVHRDEELEAGAVAGTRNVPCLGRCANLQSHSLTPPDSSLK